MFKQLRPSDELYNPLRARIDESVWIANQPKPKPEVSETEKQQKRDKTDPTKFLGKKIPSGGGFYLRTLPKKIIKNAIKNYEKQNIPATFYIHSWELTPEYFPKIKLPMKEHFVTFHNIDTAFNKMDEIIQKFEFSSFSKFLSKNTIA